MRVLKDKALPHHWAIWRPGHGCEDLDWKHHLWSLSSWAQGCRPHLSTPIRLFVGIYSDLYICPVGCGIDCHHTTSQDLPPFYKKEAPGVRLGSCRLGFGSRGAWLLACKRKSKWAPRADSWTAGGADSTGRILPRWGNNRWIDVFKTVDSSALLYRTAHWQILQWVCKTSCRHGKVFFSQGVSCASAPPQREDLCQHSCRTDHRKQSEQLLRPPQSPKTLFFVVFKASVKWIMSCIWHLLLFAETLPTAVL